MSYLLTSSKKKEEDEFEKSKIVRPLEFYFFLRQRCSFKKAKRKKEFLKNLILIELLDTFVCKKPIFIDRALNLSPRLIDFVQINQCACDNREK